MRCRFVLRGRVTVADLCDGLVKKNTFEPNVGLCRVVVDFISANLERWIPKGGFLFGSGQKACYVFADW